MENTNLLSAYCNSNRKLYTYKNGTCAIYSNNEKIAITKQEFAFLEAFHYGMLHYNTYKLAIADRMDIDELVEKFQSMFDTMFAELSEVEMTTELRRNIESTVSNIDNKENVDTINSKDLPTVATPYELALEMYNINPNADNRTISKHCKGRFSTKFNIRSIITLYNELQDNNGVYDRNTNIITKYTINEKLEKSQRIDIA